MLLESQKEQLCILNTPFILKKSTISVETGETAVPFSVGTLRQGVYGT